MGKEGRLRKIPGFYGVGDIELDKLQVLGSTMKAAATLAGEICISTVERRFRMQRSSGNNE